MAGFTKKDLIEAIQETVKRELALGQKDKNRISDLVAMIKGAINSNSADDEMKSMADNMDALKSLFEEVSSNVAKQTDEIKKGSSKKPKAENMAEALALRNQKDRDAIATQTFKQRMAEQISMNRNVIRKFITSPEFQTNKGSSQAFIGNIARSVNSSVGASLGGEGMDEKKSQELVAKALEDMIVSINRKQRGYADLNIKHSENMFSKTGAVIKKMGDGVGKFLGGSVGASLYDVLNMITDGQLGVIRSMAGSAGRMGEAVGHIYSGVKEQFETVFADEKKGLIDPAVNVVKGVGSAAGMEMFKSKEKKTFEVQRESRNILKQILGKQEELLGTTNDQYKWNLRQRGSDLFKKLKAFFVEVLIFLSGAVGFVLGGVVGQIKTRFQALFMTIKAIFLPFRLIAKLFTSALLLVKPIRELGTGLVFLVDVLSGTSNFSKKLEGLFKIFKSIPTLGPDVLKNVSMLAGFFGRLSNLKGLSALGSFGSGLANMITKISGIVFKIITKVRMMVSGFKVFLDGGSALAKMFGKFFSMFKLGMKFLGWPLTIFMGIIDFVKGFANTEGTIVDKVLGGLKAAIMGIVEMPLKMIGWIFDKLTGSEGSGDKIVKFVSDWIDFFFSGIGAIFGSLWDTAKSFGGHVMDIINGIVDIFKGIVDFFSALGDFDLDKMGDALGLIWDGIMGIFDGLLGGFWDLASSVPKMLLAFVQSLWPKIEELARGTIFEPFVWFFAQIGSIVKGIVDEIMGLVKKIPFIGDAVKSDVEKRTESVKKAAEMKGRLQDIESGKETFIGIPFGKSSEERKAAAIAEIKADIEKQDKETAKYTPMPEAPKMPDIMAPEQKGAIRKGVDQAMMETKTLMGKSSATKPSELVAPAVKQAVAETKAVMGPSAAAAKELAVKGSSQYDSQINEASKKYGVDPNLVKSVMKTESNFNPNAKSPVGAAGLMQMMPGTAKDLGVTDRFDPQQSIEGGTKYLAQLSKRFGGDTDKTLAAYNWGMGNVEKKGMGAMPKETRDYLKKVKGNMPEEMAKTGAPTGLSDTVNSVEVAKQGVARRQMEQSKSMENSITEMNKNASKKSEAPIVVSNGGGENRGFQEPPVDVESMSILWLNKSWGLG